MIKFLGTQISAQQSADKSDDDVHHHIAWERYSLRQHSAQPSGHASGAFAFFLALAVLAGRGQPTRLRLTWMLLGCIPAAFIALSRVYLGAHWPTDILAGTLLAMTVCAFSLAISQYRTPLPAMPQKTWWLLLPAIVAVLGFIALTGTNHAMLRYAY